MEVHRQSETWSTDAGNHLAEALACSLARRQQHSQHTRDLHHTKHLSKGLTQDKVKALGAVPSAPVSRRASRAAAPRESARTACAPLPSAGACCTLGCESELPWIRAAAPQSVPPLTSSVRVWLHAAFRVHHRCTRSICPSDMRIKLPTGPQVPWQSAGSRTKRVTLVLRALLKAIVQSSLCQLHDRAAQYTQGQLGMHAFLNKLHLHARLVGSRDPWKTACSHALHPTASCWARYRATASCSRPAPSCQRTA